MKHTYRQKFQVVCLCLFLVLQFKVSSQVLSAMQAVVSNGHIALQINGSTNVSEYFQISAQGGVTLDFYFDFDDVRNGTYSAQAVSQPLGGYWLDFGDVPFQFGTPLNFHVLDTLASGLIREYVVRGGDVFMPDNPQDVPCPISLECTTSNRLYLRFDPSVFTVSLTNVAPVTLFFGPGNPDNMYFEIFGIAPTLNAFIVSKRFESLFVGDCSTLLQEVTILLNGHTCKYVNGQLVSSSCSPFGDYYTPGESCAEYFENCTFELTKLMEEKRTELPCRQWKEKSLSTCGTNTFIYRPGKVSIGTSKQGPHSSAGGKASLSVKNGVITDKVKVKLCDATWCDYVFEPNYPLRSLPETEAYILQNCHLPGMPSGGEIEAEGAFELGEITRLQQEKIEEMYLHLIALQKEVEWLEIELTLLEWRERAVKK